MLPSGALITDPGKYSPRPMVAIAVAAPSDAAIQSAAEVARAGGGAVDAAIASVLTACVNEVGVVAPGAGVFIAVATPEREVAVFDGYVAVPGLVDDDDPGSASQPALIEVSMAYGGGLTTLVGPGSIATPGLWAALDDAHTAFGRVAWRTLVDPAVRLARGGFPLGQASHTYLRHAANPVFGHDPASRALVLGADDEVIPLGTHVVLEDLAETLDEIGRHGAGHLHGGRLGAAMTADLRSRGSLLTRTDLARYRAIRRVPTRLHLAGWDLHSNPAPAIGGEAMLGTLERITNSDVRSHVHAQHEVFDARGAGDPLRAGSTVHVSAVDADGLACAITASAGYGSGVIPSGTGFWMNNALGELELVPDIETLAPGSRLMSNMAPTVAVGPQGETLAIGSPGADRITSALAQVLWRILVEGRGPSEAIASPRVHVAITDGIVWSEPGLVADDSHVIDGLEARTFDALHMYFGGVGVAMHGADGTLEAAADPRRDGSAAVVGR